MIIVGRLVFSMQIGKYIVNETKPTNIQGMSHV